MTNKYVFNLTAMNINSLLDQVALALEKRTELISRAKNPKMRAYTDKLNSKEKVSKEVSKRRKVFRKIMSIINLLLGVFLLIPGLMEPQELTFILLVGIFAIIIGLIGLFGNVATKKIDFIRPAHELLSNKDKIVKGENQVIFLDDRMELQNNINKKASVSYSEFEYIIETEDIFLITYKGMATILQKIDLQNNMLNDFYDFISTMEFYVPAI